MYLEIDIKVKHKLPEQDVELIKLMEEDPNEVFKVKKDELIADVASALYVLPEEVNHLEVVIKEED